MEHLGTIYELYMNRFIYAGKTGTPIVEQKNTNVMQTP